jgi:inosine/guanosine/xanthosine phosphorylase family protein
VATSVALLAATLDGRPVRSAVVCGSGLAGLAARLGGEVVASFASLGLPSPRVAGHNPQVFYSPAGGGTLVLAGRVHLYEGYSADDVAAGVRCAAGVGARRLVVTNAAASVHPEWPPGSLVAISDHLNLTGANPLTGPSPGGNPDGGPGAGPRFVDMGGAYDPAWRDAVLAGGGVDHAGVYAAVLGPSYETPAEVRMLAGLGADLIGMSTVCEVVAARQLGVRVLGLSLVTNLAAGLADGLDHAEVVAVGAAAGDAATEVVAAALAVAPDD